MSVTQKHQTRYALAWNLYQDETLSEESRLVLEQEMDSAQNDFSWDEFQVFKATLPDYIKHWDGIKDKMLSQLLGHGLTIND